jgi:hypothetical protein
MPPRKPVPSLTVERATPTERKARYVVEIRSAAGVSHFLTTADWTDRERDAATAAILPLLGLKPTDPKRQARGAQSGESRSAKPK